ncbi:Uu.00g064200.m01.CDS01 [Anthostomella pinea]|uniref:non-specific serine/threonine protein kinase n=1 Tax=Anthostomella pinea TaxID=933095 RepID=A0AAI8VU51_9PEZI|nr:Uu.00g064200.m01.CDS01 [Anthostomella pinea]
MDPQQPQPQRPYLAAGNNPTLLTNPSRTANSTPMSSPGLFSPSNPRQTAFPPHAASEASTPAPVLSSPYLHPLQNHRVRETHKALVDLDLMTGRKIINQYEVIEELGRGVHGKVKLARNLETGDNVAIKIIPRFSKKRRLGKVTASPQDKTKREIAILKKIRHPNVVALLEVIDDPELKKIYMVLEHVELGEVVWRKKGLPTICNIERRRVETEMHGELSTEEEERYVELLERRQALNELKRAKMQETQKGPDDFWSIEYGAANEDEAEAIARSLGRDTYSEAHAARMAPSSSRPASRAPSISRSHGPSAMSASRASTPLPSEFDISSVGVDADNDAGSEIETPGPLYSQTGSSTALEGTMYGAYSDDPMLRGRSPSMADSIISHMSSVDYNTQPHDPFADDFSYVPCFTIDHARATFRDTVLGLEYLHYEGVVHRDIKPANLLWSRDQRVKISDFGVSYFGRPIREGEPDDLVSESEARDFDDDLELAKTVGTPAFFAPELCYTDLDEEQPKISEQIDVWSLGVTLYCLIFARIPFMAEDEFQMFKKIAKEEIYIPRRRLKPVDPHHFPASTSLYKRVSGEPYRDDNTLAYEEVDDLLYDLLRRMLTKNPEKRIRLREVKRHPWVVIGIQNLISWIDETDPSHRTAGRKIEVDEREITRAVVPLTFLERARSAVKKAVGKVIHRTDKGESQTRRRATSSAASSAGDLSNMASTPQSRDTRRKSLRGDDYFATVKESDHPLSHSVSVTPQESPTEEGPCPSQQDPTLVGGDSRQVAKGSTSDFNVLPDLGAPPSTSTSLSSTQDFQSYRYEWKRSSVNDNTFLPLATARQSVPATPAGQTSIGQIASLRKARDMRSKDDSSRSRSVDRGLFASVDKRAEAKVALSTAVAPGNFERPKRTLSVHPPGASRPKALQSYRHGQPNLDPSSDQIHFGAVDIEQRPMTAHRTFDGEGQTPSPRVLNSSTPASFGRARAQMVRRQEREIEEQGRRDEFVPSRRGIASDYASCPTSPSHDYHIAMPKPQLSLRGDTVGTATTFTSASSDAISTPLTSPSEVTSPINIVKSPGQNDESHTYPSNPSLPALLSGASSVSADTEGDFLLRPGSVNRPSLIDTTESLTPPALTKEPIEGFPLADEEHYPTLLLSRATHGLGTASLLSSKAVEDDEEDSDSDEGLTMAKSRKKSGVKQYMSSPIGKPMTKARRRDTQTSIGSQETAKKVLMQSR